jgi:type I restriction enzyme S subunit
VSDLPTGWARATFGDVVTRMSNGMPGVQNKDGNGVPVSRIETIADQRIDFGRIGYVADFDESHLEKYKLLDGDVLFSHINSPTHLGKTAIFSGGNVLYHGINLLRIQVNRALITPPIFDFACKFLRFKGEFSLRAQHAVNQSSLNQTKLAAFPISLPPLAEQKRIADKLDTVLTRVDAVNTCLARVAPLLKRFRQSVLAAATSGRLTEDWRSGHPADETWRVIPLGQYVENYDGARVPIAETLRTERRGAYPYYGASGVIDTIDGFTHEGKFVLIGEDGANLITRSKPIAFIANGRIWVNNHAHVLKCKGGAPDEYLAYYINSIDLTPYVSGSAQPKLNQKNLNTIPVPVPPTEEQTEIVRRVETLFAFADRLEARLAQAQTAATRLTPALLAKAFRGELVPQDPNDEPAAELLRRLQAQRATAAPASKAGAGRGRGRKAAAVADM